MKQKLFLIFLFLSIVFLGCKKKIETKYIMVPDEFKTWTVFQKDSYWIYLNENTNQIDCTFVTYSNRMLYTDNDPYIHVYTEYYSVHFSSGFLSFFYIKAGEGPYTQQDIFEYHTSGLGLTSGRLENPFVQYGYIDPSHRSKVIEVIPSLHLNNSTYTNVYNILWTSQNNKGDSIIENYYLTKNIGLIKFTSRIANVDTTWSLLRYHIIQ